MKKETETIWSGSGIATFDFSLKWWRFKRRYKQWKRKRWDEKNPVKAKQYNDIIDQMVDEVDHILAYGGDKEHCLHSEPGDEP